MLDRLLIKAEDVDLSGDDIKKITEGKCEIVVYHNLANFSSIDDVLGANGCAVILYETKQNFGHWVCLFKIDNNTLEFFDPYGFKMDSELKYATYDNQAYLSQLVQASNYKLIENTTKLQTWAEDVNTCGRWAAVRVKMRNIQQSDFIKMFKKNQHYTADLWVSALTYLTTFDKSS
jgi:hypothetical protein